MRTALIVASLFIGLDAGFCQAGEEVRLTLSVSTETRTGRPLPAGQYRVVLSDRTESHKYWQEAVKNFLQAAGLKIRSWDDTAEKFVKPGGSPTTIDDIIVEGRPTFSEIELIAATQERISFKVEGQVHPDHLALMAVGNPLKSVGYRIVYQK